MSGSPYGKMRAGISFLMLDERHGATEVQSLTSRTVCGCQSCVVSLLYYEMSRKALNGETCSILLPRGSTLLSWLDPSIELRIRSYIRLTNLFVRSKNIMLLPLSPGSRRHRLLGSNFERPPFVCPKPDPEFAPVAAERATGVLTSDFHAYAHTPPTLFSRPNAMLSIVCGLVVTLFLITVVELLKVVPKGAAKRDLNVDLGPAPHRLVSHLGVNESDD